jgi:hypothetical protein
MSQRGILSYLVISQDLSSRKMRDDWKKALTEDITKIYTGVGLPAFYVVINFMKLPPGDTWVGAENRTEKPLSAI